MEGYVLKTRIIRLALLLLFLILFTSCDEAAAAYRVAQGNYSYARGSYQKANLNYFMAEEKNAEPEIIEFNLGTVFYALGEAESAGELWKGVVPGENQELAFRLIYNQGILQYRDGAYHEAYGNFKKALQIDPSSMEAKINLEHSFAKMNARESGTPEAASGSSAVSAGSEEIQRVLEFIRRNEPVTPPRRQGGETSGGNDW